MAPLDRRRSGLKVDEDAVLLFARLEKRGRGARDREDYKRDEKALHDKLGLGGALLLSVQSVLKHGRSSEPRPWLASHADWRECQAARKELLRLARERELL
jgi:hypothetical protein